MLKTADGSISGSLKVIESIKNNKKNKKKSKDNTSDWTWKEQVSNFSLIRNVSLKQNNHIFCEICCHIDIFTYFAQ